ncbi:N-(5'-phosphoribosyl)anthranilate isomerase [Spirochaetia bacterium]|nr:N-(5'-phosphoribosyl)anthranilate isomerase [Spirochaetia bacterium]
MKIKICGLFREEDISYVNEAKPDYAGFVFAPSRRQVSREKAAKLREKLKDGIIPVGVFVNAPAEEIAMLFRNGVIGIAQLHGNEDETYINALKNLCDIPLIQVIKSGRLETAAEEKSLIAEAADYILFDNETAGSGKVFDWNLLANAKDSFIGKNWFLAGGIDMQTIDRAMSFGPYALDVSSGAESDGVKNRDKIIALVEKAHSTD